MKMRAILIAGLAVLLLALPAVAQQQSHLNKVLDRGVLRVGTTGDYYPMSFRDPATNEYTGHQIDAAKRFAQDIGVKLEFVPTDWKTLINGIVADKYDIVMTGTSMSMGRAKSAAFTTTWGVTGFSPLVLKKNSAKYKTWADLNKPEVTIGVNLGTTFVPFIQRELPNAKLVQVESPSRDWQELLAGRVDVTITSILEGSGLVERHPETTMLFPDQVRESLPMAFIVPIDDPIWLNFVNSWVTMSKQTGVFADINKKWSLQGQTMAPAQQ